MKIDQWINRDIQCSCGRTHRCDIASLRIGSGVIEELPSLTAAFSHILLVSDQNTAPLAEARACELLGDRVEKSFVYSCEDLLVPNEESIEALEAQVSDQTDLILGIGSGVINDLCKYVSFLHGIESGIIATATSMDGYASSGAAMIQKGMKITHTTHAPSVIVGDVDILKNAPMDMIRSGYADIIGKYSALCDWKLSALVNGEYLCQPVYDLVKEETDSIRACAKKIVARDPEAIGKLMEVLVLIGACLTLVCTTRPGSGSEHHLSHYFEITGLIDDKPYFLHGTDVGYATVVTAGLRETLCKLDAPTFKTLSDETRKACYQSIYKKHWSEVWELQEEAGRYKREDETRALYRARWEEIKSILFECPTADEIREMLLEVGFDLSLFEKMYGERKIQNAVWVAKDLKDRYSVLWLYDAIFFGEEEAKETYEKGNL